MSATPVLRATTLAVLVALGLSAEAKTLRFTSQGGSPWVA